MKIIKQSWSFHVPVVGADLLRSIESAGRTCYKSEEKVDTENFIRLIIARGHESVLEHGNASVRIVTDRGVTHELVRHRIASYSQESTRYCNYASDRFGNQVTFILPVWFYAYHAQEEFDGDWPSQNKIPMNHSYYEWLKACQDAEKHYLEMLRFGSTPQEARAVLPNSLKTEIVMTANLREWRHFFRLRTAPAAHPQMRELAESMLSGFRQSVPVVFELV